ncbi:MAG TPA: hypothetical protein VFH17_02040 [Coriobacteriia bacterium]|nr:hypothetical protein [Coriobacteriia bacterium]
MLTAEEIVRYTVGLAAMTGVAVLAPWAGMRVLLPSLQAGPAVRNYRGAEVSLGLGVVWVFWGAALLSLEALVSATATTRLFGGPAWFEPSLIAPLVLGAFLFGLIDDTFGTPGHRGFRGHLAALAERRLTTGALKLFGIGALALAGAAAPALGDQEATVASAGRYIAAALVIALAANTVNLFDLRPARALKVYCVLVVAGIAGGVAAGVAGGAPASVATSEGLVLLVAAAGPVIAVWGPDAREQAMLGDAGANAFGMFAGLVLVWSLPDGATIAAAALLLALNLLSERVSFSAVIEDVPWLAALDRWGRPPQR